METKDAGDFVFLYNSVKNRKHIVRGGRVEACDRLVSQDQTRLLRKRPRNADTLLLPSAEVADSFERLI
jgi:hypothetical protein